MKNLLILLTDLLNQAVAEAFPGEELSVELTQSTQEKFGHYQCNSPMKWAKSLQKPPRWIAEQIVSHLTSADQWIEQPEIAGPGFINFRFRPSFLSQQLDHLMRDAHLGCSIADNPKRIVIDFSSPNIAKEMHVGHLRSTIIGDALARIFEFFGHDVLRLNHVGDWGTSFGMLIAYMKEVCPLVVSGETSTNLTSLVDWYRASKKKFDEDPVFRKQAQLEVVQLQAGEEKALRAWRIICEISRLAYQEIYDLLGVHIHERGESFYNPYLPAVVQDLEQKGLLKISDGAKCLFLEGFYNREQEPLPLMIQKSDGGYNYATTDMAAMKHRIEEEKADRIIIVTDAGQATHFAMIFQAAEKAGYLDLKKIRVDHVPFGLVLGLDGKKFRTRSGDTEKLIDLLNAAVEKAEHILQERSPDRDAKERERLAKALGIGAIKYADLSSHRLSDYTFSYDRMLKFEGNTAAFLMYAYVRVQGIKRKVKSDLKDLLKTSHIDLKHPSELSLGLHLLQFSEVLDSIAEDLLPHRLTDYLYSLAEKFHVFFRDCRVEGTSEEKERYLLCEATGSVLRKGLELLGLTVVEKM